MTEQQTYTEDEVDEILDQQKEDLAKELSYGSPEDQASLKDSIFKFFREILRTNDSKKVGNLTDVEITNMRIYLNLANYGDVEGMTKVSEYMRKKAEIIAATSMSRKGFLAQLFVTQIKREQKVRSQPAEQKGFFFGKKTQQAEE